LPGETNLGTIRLEELEERNKIFIDAARSLSGDEVHIDFNALQKHLKNIHDRTIRSLRFTPDMTIGSFASVLIELLNFVYDTSTANAHPFFPEICGANAGNAGRRAQIAPGGIEIS
jgi:hypothetical protein